MNPHPLVYETSALATLSYSAVKGGSKREQEQVVMTCNCLSCSCSCLLLLILVARGGIEPRAFPPNSFRFGLEDRCRERGRCPICFSLSCRNQPGLSYSGECLILRARLVATRQAKAYRTFSGRGVRQPRASSNSTTQSVGHSAEMSHAPIIRRQEREQEAGAGNNFGSPPFCSCSALLLNWCLRKDLNLQPLVCRTSASVS